MNASTQHDFTALTAKFRHQYECDVLVIGSGAGGLSTAVTAATQGLNVIVAENSIFWWDDCRNKLTALDS
jgi:ribulose 1,5-bisphosphate synthetase/thiazole synthase